MSRRPPPWYRDLDLLGALDPVEPASRGVDGFPELGRDQVYVFKSGERYHSIPCETVMERWDTVPWRVLVVAESGIGKRERCQICARDSV